MNRNVSQTVNVLGVDGTLVEQWAFRFKDYLSPDANPSKGKPRTFREADLLALAYVCCYWDAVDTEDIEIGLNRDEHYEDRFREILYWHTPLLQEPPDDLDETWSHGILLCGGGSYEYLGWARNYRYVAESMLESALEKDELNDWAYPVLFAYRHTLELYLKIIGEIDERTHKLERCVYLVEKRYGKKLREPIREWILELDKIDPAGTGCRYADAGLDSIRITEHWFDLRHFKFAMKQVFDEIDMAILHVGATGKPVKKKNKKKKK